MTLAARAIRPERVALAAALVGLNPVIVVHTVGGGHVDGLIAAPLAAACALVATCPPARSVRAFAITVLITLACLVKTVMLPVLLLWFAWLARPRGVRALALHLLVVAALIVATAGAFVSASHPWAPYASLGGIEFWASPSHFVARAAQTFVVGVAGPHAGHNTRVVVEAAFPALRRPPVATRSTGKGRGSGSTYRGMGDRTVLARVVASVPPSVVRGVVRSVPGVLRGRRAHICRRVRLRRARIDARSCRSVSRLDDTRSDGRSPLRRRATPPSRSRRQRGAPARAPAGKRRTSSPGCQGLGSPLRERITGVERGFESRRSRSLRASPAAAFARTMMTCADSGFDSSPSGCRRDVAGSGGRFECTGLPIGNRCVPWSRGLDANAGWL